MMAEHLLSVLKNKMRTPIPNNPSKWLKRSFFFFAFLAVYYAFVFAALPFFADPQVHRFEEYKRIFNWDLRQHAKDDFDNDGQEDLISFTGCAFLSSVDATTIPQDQQCTATGITSLVFHDQDNRIGQKYVQTDETYLHLDAFRTSSPISHSFIAKDAGENWKIFINSKNGLQIYEVKNSGLLETVDEVTLANKIDEFFYSLSRFFILLALPLIPLSFVFSPIFLPFRSASQQIPVHEIVTLSFIAVVLFVMWRKSLDRTQSDR